MGRAEFLSYMRACARIQENLLKRGLKLRPHRGRTADIVMQDAHAQPIYVVLARPGEDPTATARRANALVRKGRVYVVSASEAIKSALSPRVGIMRPDGAVVREATPPGSDDVEYVTICVRLPKKTVEKIDAMRGSLSRAGMVAAALEYGLGVIEESAALFVQKAEEILRKYEGQDDS